MQTILPNVALNSSGAPSEASYKPIEYTKDASGVSHLVGMEKLSSNKLCFLSKKEVVYQAERTLYKPGQDLVFNISSNENLVPDSCYLKFKFTPTGTLTDTKLYGPVGLNVIKSIEITANSGVVETLTNVNIISRLKTEFTAPKSYVEGTLGMSGFMQDYSADTKRTITAVEAKDGNPGTIRFSTSQYSSFGNDYEGYLTTDVGKYIIVPMHIISEFFSIRKVLPMAHIGVIKIRITLEDAPKIWATPQTTATYELEDCSVTGTLITFNEMVEAAIANSVRSGKYMIPYKQWFSSDSVTIENQNFSHDISKAVTSLNGVVFVLRTAANISPNTAKNLLSTWDTDVKVTKSRLRVGSEYFPSSTFVNTPEEHYLHAKKFWVGSYWDCSVDSNSAYYQWKNGLAHLCFDLEADRSSYATGRSVSGNGVNVSLEVERSAVVQVVVTSFMNYNAFLILKGQGQVESIY